jgi:hypothetical protein
MNLYAIRDRKTGLHYGDAKGVTALAALQKFLSNATIGCTIFQGKLAFIEEQYNRKWPDGQDSFLVEKIEEVE